MLNPDAARKQSDRTFKKAQGSAFRAYRQSLPRGPTRLKSDPGKPTTPYIFLSLFGRYKGRLSKPAREVNAS